MVKWEIALFELNLRVSHFHNSLVNLCLIDTHAAGAATPLAGDRITGRRPYHWQVAVPPAGGLAAALVVE